MSNPLRALQILSAPLWLQFHNKAKSWALDVVNIESNRFQKNVYLQNQLLSQDFFFFFFSSTVDLATNVWEIQMTKKIHVFYILWMQKSTLDIFFFMFLWIEKSTPRNCIALEFFHKLHRRKKCRMYKLETLKHRQSHHILREVTKLKKAEVTQLLGGDTEVGIGRAHVKSFTRGWLCHLLGIGKGAPFVTGWAIHLGSFLYLHMFYGKGCGCRTHY